jgi:predicted DNA-binding transcriptional regulator
MEKAISSKKGVSSVANRTLSGTTLRVYRYLFRNGGKPVGVHEVQSSLGLSSASVAHYHIRKLVDDGLVKEGLGGYVVGKFYFENRIRIGRSLLPFQAIYLLPFLVSLFSMVDIFRAEAIQGGFLIAVSLNAVVIGVFAFETFRSMHENYR